MTISEESRHRLYQRLEEVLGEAEAATMMEHLPPVGWADVATKRDLDALQTSIRAELELFRTTTTADIQTGLTEYRNEFHVELAAVRAEHREDLRDLRTDLRDLRTEMRAYVLATLSAMVAISGTMVAAIKL